MGREYLERLRALCMAYPGVFEDFPWGHETPVFKTPKNKIIAMSGLGEDGNLHITVKLTPDEGAEALLLPFVRKADYVGRYGWITVNIAGDSEWEIAVPWVQRSYELVAGPARKGKGARPV
jgi:predicted DNA-binding protein (MmcQ/YjbR family)